MTLAGATILVQLVNSPNTASIFVNQSLIAGTGTITISNAGYPRGLFINSGTVTANAGAGLTIDSQPCSYTLLINHGILRASGTTLTLSTPTIDNTTGIVDILSNSTLALEGIISGGTLSFGNNTFFKRISGGLLNVAAITNLTLVGTPTLPDAVRMSRSIGFTGTLHTLSTSTITLTAPTTFTGGGTLALASAGAVINTTNTFGDRYGTQPLSFDLTIAGAGQLGQNTIRFLNNGTISANSSTGIIIDPVDATNGFTSTGTLRADSASLNFLNSTYTISGIVETKNNGSLNFNAGTFTISCPITLDGGSANFNSTASNAHNIAAITGTGKVTVGAGAALVSDAVVAKALTINGRHTLRPGLADASLVQAITLATATDNSFTATLNLNDNKFILQSDPTLAGDKSTKSSFLQSALLSGFDGGDWMGKGITSATVAADQAEGGSHLLTLALFDNVDLKLDSFGGQAVDGNSLLIATAYIGDANLNTVVDGDDFVIWYDHKGQYWPAQSEGDFNHDGAVDGRDFVLWYGAAGAAGPQVLSDRGLDAGALAAVEVPEPGTALVVLGLVPVVLKRRKRERGGVQACGIPRRGSGHGRWNGGNAGGVRSPDRCG